MTSSTPSTHRASFAIGDEQSAKRVVDLLTESFFEGQAAIAAFEGPGGRWDITVHFADAPDQTSIRELVAIAAGDDVAQDISFDTVEARDWVKATLEQLIPVRAGRFVVHGRHASRLVCAWSGQRRRSHRAGDDPRGDRPCGGAGRRQAGIRRC